MTTPTISEAFSMAQRGKPPEGYYTASTARRKLGNISDGMLRTYIQRGLIERTVPPGRKQGFYKREAVDKLAKEIQSPWSDNILIKSHIKPVETLSEMQECINIANIVFGGTDDTSMEVYEGRIKANPYCYHMVKSNNKIVGFIGIIPLREGMLSEVLAQTVPVNISNNDVVSFKPGTVTEIYISVMVTRPNVPTLYRHAWGARMIRYLMRLIKEWGYQGIIIKTIGARSAIPDGIKLLQHLGFTEIKRATPERRTFIIDVEKSGIPFIEQYQEAIGEWKAKWINEGMQH
jgi:hypothetical protein